MTALSLALTSLALAAPLPVAEPTLGLSALQGKIDASPDGRVEGFLKTVVKGSDVTTIPVSILAITGDITPSSALILFEASGPLIDKYGGIAQGMSGSPIYVEDAGEDKVVGALSYGDQFTKSGTGLATPIEAMVDLEQYIAPRVETLAKPVITSEGVVKRVLVVPNPQDFSGASAQGTLVAKPLSAVYIGGLRPGSPLYKRFEKGLAKRGLNAVALIGQLGSTPAVGDSGFTTPLVPGGAVAAMASRGDAWEGGIGTITRTDSATVLAFGHPAYYGGETTLYMTNAWIDGVWPSSAIPYKLGRPGAVRGTIIEDRGAGIVGITSHMPSETVITETATNVQSGVTTTTACYIPRDLVNTQAMGGFDLGGYASVAGARLFDQAYTPGSAEVTTTVVVSDGAKTYTVTIPNVMDNAEDMPSSIGADVYTATDSLYQVLSDGYSTLDIQSIHVDARISPKRRSAQIVGVNVPGGLRTGLNTAVISLLAYGKQPTQTVEATFAIPAGMPLNGTLSVAGLTFNPDDGYFVSLGSTSSDSMRPTVAEIVDDLNATQANNVMSVTYQARPIYIEPVDENSSPTMKTFDAVEATTSSQWVNEGQLEYSAPSVTAAVVPSPVSYGGTFFVVGNVGGPSSPTTVTVYGTAVGSSAEQTLATGMTTVTDGFGSYRIGISGLTTNTNLRIKTDAADGYIDGSATTVAKISARVSIASSATSAKSGRYVTLTAKILPSTTVGGKVVFEYYNRGWKKLGTKTLTPTVGGSTAKISYKVLKGSHMVRATYQGGTFNAKGSATRSVVGR